MKLAFYPESRNFLESRALFPHSRDGQEYVLLVVGQFEF